MYTADFGPTGDIQTYTIPATGNYLYIPAGAQGRGYDDGGGSGHTGGLGVTLNTTNYGVKDSSISIVIGERGEVGSHGDGEDGGTFVYDAGTNLLYIAVGGQDGASDDQKRGIASADTTLETYGGGEGGSGGEVNSTSQYGCTLSFGSEHVPCGVVPAV